MSLIFRTLLVFAFMTSPIWAQVPQPPAEPVQAEAGVEDLIRLLENETTRNQLIERLRSAEPPSAAEAAEESFEPTIARQIAEYTRNIAESASDTVAAAVDLTAEIGEVVARSTSQDYAQFLRAMTNVAVLALVLLVGFFLLRAVATRIERALGARASGRRWLPRIVAAVIALIIDAGAVLAAWATGYAVSLYFLGGPTGSMGINQTLLLNAFLVVEATKVLLRLVLQPSNASLRFAAMSDTTAAYWYFWASRLVGLIGYSFMFFAPIVADGVSLAAAQALRVLAMLTALLIGVLIILQNKTAVRRALKWRAENGRHDALSRTLALIGAYWHILAIAYLIAIFVVWLANPEEALPFMLGATVQSILSVLVGVLIISFISRFIHVGVRLPDDVKARLPLLEARLHAFVPRVMQVVRTVVLIGIVIAIAQAWGLIDFLGWAASETGQRVTGSVLSALIILLVGFVIYLALSSWVEYRLNPNFGTVPTAREKTLLSLFRNASTIALAVFVVMLALAQVGINIAPLLAGAGVLGLAIGFGAQKFVQDIITGIFIQLENIMNEGDVVEAGGKSGVVEKLTIRSVSIRSLDGTLHLIPFSSVDMVSNSMKGFSFHMAEIGVAYDRDINNVRTAMHEAFDHLMETDFKDSVLEPLEMHGITLFGDSAITVRARIKTAPGAQWALGRKYNELIKDAFDRHGIEIPFPQVTYHMADPNAGDILPKPRRQVAQGSDVSDRPTVDHPES
ncbi:MAG TPA: mechanosensitive ion channel domain-containing protein [Tianweitania sediminis]|nr:mechanosensitive ion channel domain-containing protein [Tianweitania sediminis]